MANGNDTIPSAPDATPTPAAAAKPTKKYKITDPKSGDSVTITGPAENPDQGRLRAMAQQEFARRRTLNPIDLAKSIPRGAVRGLMSTPALLGQMGRAEIEAAAAPFTAKTDLPPALTAEQLTSQIETAVGYQMHKPETRGGRIGERIGEFAGDIPTWIGPGGFIRKALTATLGAIGSEEGERIGTEHGHPILGAAIGATVAGTVGGFGAGGRGLPGRVTKDVREATTEEALKKASQAGYKQLEQFDHYRLSEGQNAILTHAIKNYLIAEEGTVFPEYLAPKTWRTLDDWLLKARTVADVERVRQVLNQTRIEGGNEALASSKAIEAIDDYMYELPGVKGVAQQARGDWAAYKRGQMVEETIRRGMERAATSGKGGGGNIVNTIKQEFRRRIRDKPAVWKRFSKQEQEQIKLIMEPGSALDVAHWVSNFSPRHPITGAIGFFGAGHVTGDPLSQLAILGAGEVAHRFARSMTQGRGERLLEATRARSPAGAKAAGLPIEEPYYTPRPAVPATMRAGYGAARALGATALSPGVSDALELPEIVVTPQ
jgi:hypothetical protein